MSKVCNFLSLQVACLLEEKGKFDFHKKKWICEFLLFFSYQFTFEPPTYSVSLTGETDHLMEVTPKDGVLFVNGLLDWEKKTQYRLQLEGLDQYGKRVQGPYSIIINVVDINDNAPEFNKSAYSGEVRQHFRPGNLIGIVLASDNDKKGSLNSRLQFSILDQTPKIPQDNLFRIESGTGSVHLFKSKLNRQVAKTYSLEVNVTDSVFSTICDLQIQVIDINDKIPIFEKSDYGTVIVAEDRKEGSLIFKIQATDDDEPSTGSSQIIYTITKGDPSNSFKILTDPETNLGSIIINKGLDFETNSVYNLTINATNPEPLVDGIKYNSSSSTFLLVLVINVDEPPVFLHPNYIVMLYENVTIGSNVTTIKAFDPEGYPIRYWLGKTDTNWLEIDPVNGHVYTAAPLDFELYKAYTVDIVATEESGAHNSGVTQLILHLLDVNDNPPYLVNKSVFLCHPLQKDKSAKFEVADPDSETPKFTYSLVGRDIIILFVLSDKHASITPRNLKLEQKVYEVPLKISDNGRPPMEAVVNLKGIEFFPILQPILPQLLSEALPLIS
uniref:Cadherin 17 n=1 Tax=Pseudonaja textilis TaxID=8673 RepID=A0A670Y8Q1_PSETE